jgi:hypothetical protein
MLTALLGSTGVVDLARSEFDARQQELKHPPPQSRWVELAIEPVRPVSSPTDVAVSIEDVYQSAAPDVQGLPQAMRGQVSPPRRLDVQRVQGARWISYVYSGSGWPVHHRAVHAERRTVNSVVTPDDAQSSILGEPRWPTDRRH